MHSREVVTQTWNIVWPILNWLYRDKCHFQIKVVGHNHLAALPSDRRIMLGLWNHKSYADAFLIVITCLLKGTLFYPTSFVIKGIVCDWIFGLVGRLMMRLGCVRVDTPKDGFRGHQGEAMRMLKRLKEGWPVAVFPEGIFNSKGDDIGPASPSMVAIATQTNALIVPIVIKWEYVSRRTGLPWCERVIVYIDEPVEIVRPTDRKQTKLAWITQTEAIRLRAQEILDGLDFSKIFPS